jgi:hypothetical protein
VSGFAVFIVDHDGEAVELGPHAGQASSSSVLKRRAVRLPEVPVQAPAAHRHAWERAFGILRDAEKPDDGERVRD